MAFDPLNLLLLAIAVVVFWRLKSVLGSRTGNERPPVDPMAGRTNGDGAVRPADADRKVLRFPQGAEDRTPEPAGDEEPAAPVWQGIAEPGSALATALEKISEADPSFTPKSFAEGAKMAYEMIIEGFARGDKPSLKNLLSKDVFDGFAQAITEREKAGHKLESRFVGIDDAKIVSAELAGNRASITMRFVSEMISATYDKSNAVIDGDPGQIREITDVWTFERDVTSRNPNWKLSATQESA